MWIQTGFFQVAIVSVEGTVSNCPGKDIDWSGLGVGRFKFEITWFAKRMIKFCLHAKTVNASKMSDTA